MRSFKLQRISVAILVVFTGLVLGFVPQAIAQSYAAVHGTVTDTTGAVISGATTTVLNTSTGIKNVTKADKNGYYIFPQLQVGGPYTVTISAQGFQNFVAGGLTLNVNDNREVNGKLAVGAESQTIEVSATALQVETSNTQLQQIATSDQLEGVPMEGRDPAGLQKLQPGVVESNDRFGTFSSNGSQTAQNSYLLNGVDINDPALQSEGIQINPDALQEENIVTSTMNPEFGRNSGATVNQILKAGTNHFHGNGFEFYRDSFLTNGNYFTRPLTPGATTHENFHQNLYGGTLGGPVYKNKLFFFLAYQGQRRRNATTTVNTTMDTSQFAGEDSNNSNYGQGNVANNTPFDNTVILSNGQHPCPKIPAKVYSDSLSCSPMPFAVNTATGLVGGTGTTWIQAFDNGVGGGAATINIPTTSWDPVAKKLINKFVPTANFGSTDANGQQNQVNFTPADTYASDQGIIRIDFTPSSKDSIWGSTVFMSNPQTTTLTFGGGSFPGFASKEASHFKLFSVSWTHTFNPAMLNELRGSYYRNPFMAVGVSKVDPPSNYGFSINPQDSQSGVPYIGVGSYFDLGFSYEGPQPRLDTNLTYADNFTWVKGNHTLKFGGSFEQFRVHNPFDVYNNGYYSFNGAGSYTSGDPLLDFTLGVPDQFEQTNNGFINAVAEELYGYGQDNWKVSPDFTFNYGLSWDVEKPNQNHQDGGLGIVCWSNSNYASTVFPGASPGLSFPGDPGCNGAGGVVAHYNRFAPRIGFAWSPSKGPAGLIGNPGAHDFSIRAGFGVYYNRDQEEQSLQNLEDPPFLQYSLGAGDFGGSPGFANPYADVAGNGSETNPAPWAPVTPKSTISWTNYLEEELAVFDKSYSVPYTYNYNLNIQRSLGANLLAQVGYVGSVSHRLASWNEGDPITAAGHTACLANPDCATNPYFDRSFPQYMTQTANYAGYPYYLSVADQTTEGNSNYNSLQASLIKAPTNGLQFTIAYTYSHALDDGSGYESSTGGAGRVRNYTPGFAHLNYGSSDYDARHRLVASYVYTVPVAGFLKSNVFAREALGGWGVSGITALQTGFPIGIRMGTTRSQWCSADSYFGCGDVPVYSGAAITKSNIRSSTNRYFDKTPFTAEQWGTFGNTSRNFFHGPGFDYTNVAVTKNVHFTADNARYVQLRLEAFNAFNHANFANPSGNFSSSNFGKVTSVDSSSDPNGDPSGGRSVQLAGKFFF
ncbi:MAG: carboxypeptidase-like regulatory domain-containing protein [Negativicutes bacterium]|nr:carboxypeptidase-like regulatory domain-containing protein [Negativicutes bacterium]